MNHTGVRGALLAGSGCTAHPKSRKKAKKTPVNRTARRGALHHASPANRKKNFCEPHRTARCTAHPKSRKKGNKKNSCGRGWWRRGKQDSLGSSPGWLEEARHRRPLSGEVSEAAGVGGGPCLRRRLEIRWIGEELPERPPGGEERDAWGSRRAGIPGRAPMVAGDLPRSLSRSGRDGRIQRGEHPGRAIWCPWWTDLGLAGGHGGSSGRGTAAGEGCGGGSGAVGGWSWQRAVGGGRWGPRRGGWVRRGTAGVGGRQDSVGRWGVEGGGSAGVSLVGVGERGVDWVHVE